MSDTTPQAPGDKFFRYAKTFLGTIVWGSALVFGVYILLFYALAYVLGDTAQWNKVLPGLYDPNDGRSTAGIAVHFVGGGIILILGCLQMLDGVRTMYPTLHRVSGRVYVLASVAAAVGGLVFIALKGTIGGTVMDVAFTGYGVLMLVAAVQTIRFARGGDFGRHRAWAIRLFALAIGSWLYRMGYGFYIGFTDQSGHTADFRGWFDYFMDFWFYLPNLVVAEIVIARHGWFQKPWVRTVGAVVLILAGLALLFATYFFIQELWGPGIAGAFG